MENYMKNLEGKSRLLVSVELKPLQGTRFQPTGFMDIGAATYAAPDGTKMLLVESAQSMANRMEAVCWDNVNNALVEPLKGLSYVEVKNKGTDTFLTSSILEAHRINSAYILDAEDSKTDKIFSKFGIKKEKKPYNSEEKKEFVELLFKHDAGALLHGIFMPDYAGGRCRIARALSAFVEAKGVNEAVSGGVKIDIINPSPPKNKGAAEAENDGADAGENRDASTGYGNIPYSRSEYTGNITAYFSLDLTQIRNYKLGKDAEKLLVALALFKIRKVLNEGLRFRTACDLKAGELKMDAPTGFELPTENDLAKELPHLIEKCKGAFGGSPSLIETFAPSKSGNKKNNNPNGEDEAEDGDNEENDN